MAKIKQRIHGLIRDPSPEYPCLMERDDGMVVVMRTEGRGCVIWPGSSGYKLGSLVTAIAQDNFTLYKGAGITLNNDP